MADLTDFEAYGGNTAAPFTLKLYRGENMVLLAMNWCTAEPPLDFVGFGIEYCEPGASVFYPVKNRLSFLANDGTVSPNILASKQSPIQKFRWTHFPFHPELNGLYTYRVTAVFMDAHGVLGYGEVQTAQIALGGETYPGQLNIAFTRGFVASQAFADRYNKDGKGGTILPTRGKDPLTYVSPNPLQREALAWMGYEARQAINKVLKDALADTAAQVRVAAYDLDLPELVDVLEKFGDRLQIIIDDSDKHGKTTSAETHAAARIAASGAAVQRQKAGGLQHSKFIAVKGTDKQVALGGSTNFSWRGFFVQNNNAVIVTGAAQVAIFFKAFDDLWTNKNNKSGFGGTGSAKWMPLGIPGIDAELTFSPHSEDNVCLEKIAEAITGTKSSLMFSLAFLYQTEGPIKDAITGVTDTEGRFVYGISDKGVGLDLKKPDNNAPVAYPATLLENVPQPFKKEVSGGGGIRMHHKFVVIDFDTEDARVYTGSYNFSNAADRNNAENLWVFRDRKVAVSYMIQAVTMFDHYEWRDARAVAKAQGQNRLYLKSAAATAQQAWWYKDYTVQQRITDRELFSK